MHFLTLTCMNMNFTDHRKAERRAQEVAFQRSTINPAGAVDHASIATAAATSSEDSMTPSMTPRAPISRSPQPSKLTNRSKGKEPVQATTPAKRTRDGDEPEPTRKRSSQGIRLTDSAELREVAPLAVHVMALHASQGEGSLGSSSYPWTREGFKLSKSRRDLKGLT